MPGKLNFKIYKGETFKYSLRWTDSSETPINLTNYHARMHVRSSIESETILLKFASDSALLPDGTITITPLTGEIDLYLGATSTAAIDFESAVYDLELYNIADPDDVTRLIEGRVSISPEVTR